MLQCYGTRLSKTVSHYLTACLSVLVFLDPADQLLVQSMYKVLVLWIQDLVGTWINWIQDLVVTWIRKCVSPPVCLLLYQPHSLSPSPTHIQAPSQQQMRMWPGNESGGGGQDPGYTHLLLHKPAAAQPHQRHFLDPPHHPHPTYSHHGNGGRGLRQGGQTSIGGGGGQQGSSPQLSDSMDVGVSLGLHHLGAVSSMEASQFGSASLPLALPIGLSAFRTRPAPNAPGPQAPPPEDYYPASNNNNPAPGGRGRPDSDEGPANS